MRFKYLTWIIESVNKDQSLSDHEKKLVLQNLFECVDVRT